MLTTSAPAKAQLGGAPLQSAPPLGTADVLQLLQLQALQFGGGGVFGADPALLQAIAFQQQQQQQLMWLAALQGVAPFQAPTMPFGVPMPRMPVPVPQPLPQQQQQQYAPPCPPLPQQAVAEPRQPRRRHTEKRSPQLPLRALPAVQLQQQQQLLAAAPQQRAPGSTLFRQGNSGGGYVFAAALAGSAAVRSAQAAAAAAALGANPATAAVATAALPPPLPGALLAASASKPAAAGAASGAASGYALPAHQTAQQAAGKAEVQGRVSPSEDGVVSTVPCDVFVTSSGSSAGSSGSSGASNAAVGYSAHVMAGQGPATVSVDGEPASKLRRREDRNQREQRRSHGIAQQIEAMRIALGDSGLNARCSKYAVLSAVADYIRMMQARERENDAERRRWETAGYGPEMAAERPLSPASKAALGFIKLEDSVPSLADIMALDGSNSNSGIGGGARSNVNVRVKAEAVECSSTDSSGGSSSGASDHGGSSAGGSGGGSSVCGSSASGSGSSCCGSRGYALDYKRIFALAPLGMAIVALDGRFLDCNASFEALSGYSLDEIRRLSLFNIVRPDELQQTFELVSGIIQNMHPAGDCGSYVVQSTVLRNTAIPMSLSLALTRDAPGRAKYLNCALIPAITGPGALPGTGMLAQPPAIAAGVT